MFLWECSYSSVIEWEPLTRLWTVENIILSPLLSVLWWRAWSLLYRTALKTGRRQPINWTRTMPKVTKHFFLSICQFLKSRQHKFSHISVFTEYKRSRHEIKKKSSDTMKLQKKAKKGNTFFSLRNLQHDKKIGQLILWNIVTQTDNTLAYQIWWIRSILHNTALLQSRNVLRITQGHYLKVKTGCFIWRSEQPAVWMPSVFTVFLVALMVDDGQLNLGAVFKAA